MKLVSNNLPKQLHFVILLALFNAKQLYSGNTMFATTQDAEKAFELAWNNPAYTHIELNDVDVNAILREHYELERPLVFTKTKLWDMETKKAWDPKTYIPHVVRDGKSWGRQILPNGDEILVRSSAQKQWLNSDVYEEVFEEVYLNHAEQKVTFIGTTQLTDPSGTILHITNQQPLFHVEHSVKGTENNPLNGWRIIHLTDKKDQTLIEYFKNFNNAKALPKYIEVYIEKDLDTQLKQE